MLKKQKEKTGEIFVNESTGKKTTLQSGDTAFVELHDGYLLISFGRMGSDLLFLNSNDNKWQVAGNIFTAQGIVDKIAEIYGLIWKITQKREDMVFYKFV